MRQLNSAFAKKQRKRHDALIVELGGALKGVLENHPILAEELEITTKSNKEVAGRAKGLSLQLTDFQCSSEYERISELHVPLVFCG